MSTFRRRSMRFMKTTHVTPVHRRLVAACVPNLSGETIGRVALVVARWYRGLYHKGELSKQFRYAGVVDPRERRDLISRVTSRPLRSVKAVDKRTAAATLRRLGYTRVRFLPGRSTTAYPIFSAVGPEGARTYLRVSTRGTVREYDSASNAMNDVLGRQVKSITPMKIGMTFDEYCDRLNLHDSRIKREFLSYMERIPVHGRLLQKAGRQPSQTWSHYWNKWSRGPGRRVLQGLETSRSTRQYGSRYDSPPRRKHFRLGEVVDFDVGVRGTGKIVDILSGSKYVIGPEYGEVTNKRWHPKSRYVAKYHGEVVFARVGQIWGI